MIFLRDDVPDYTWTTGNNAALSHIRTIDRGASGEVHEVALRSKEILNPKLRNILTGNVYQ